MQVGLHHPGTFTIKVGDKELGSFTTKPWKNEEKIEVEI
jgi:hypothetical protein